MRVGFKITGNGEPISSALIAGTLLPPVLFTDKNGEAFAIAPVALAPATYLLNAVIIKRDQSLPIQDIAEEIENYYTIDITKKTVNRITLGTRIAGDGFYKIDMQPLRPEELIISEDDPMLMISNCLLCIYYDRIRSQCLVNGPLNPIPIKDPTTTTSRLYYPFFLPPSLDRLKRDLPRLTKAEKP